MIGFFSFTLADKMGRVFFTTDRDIFIEMSNKMTIVIEKLEDLTNTFNQKMDGLTTLLKEQKEDYKSGGKDHTRIYKHKERNCHGT